MWEEIPTSLTDLTGVDNERFLYGTYAKTKQKK
jgi:hypothetical protein